MSAERRQFLRVLFDSTIDVRTDEWQDQAATGLDISLNGCRFHCEYSMSDGESVNIHYQPGLALEGKVRWCWPIEWYYQAAVQFTEITQEEQSNLRDYITSATGEEYPALEMQNEQPRIETQSQTPSEIKPPAGETEQGMEEMDFTDLSSLDEENQLYEFAVPIDEHELEELAPLEEVELDTLSTEDTPADASPTSAALPAPQFDEGDLAPMSYAGKQLVVLGGRKYQADLLKQYLKERAGLEIEHVTKKQNLWRLMKLDPVDALIMEWDLEDDNEPLETLEQTLDQFPQTRVLAISGPVSLEHRLQAVNAGVKDFITRPVHLSAIAQSLLLHLSVDESDDSVHDQPVIMEEAHVIEASDELEPLAEDETSVSPVDLLDDDLNLSEELELLDEEF